MGTLGQFLIAAAGAGLLLQDAGAAPSPVAAATDHWIGTGGYVALPPPPRPPIPAGAATAPPPPPTPFGAFGPAAPPAAYRPSGPISTIDHPGHVPLDTRTTELNNATVRQVVRVCEGGTCLRLRLSNQNSAEMLAPEAVHVAAATTDGAVIPGSDYLVTCSGHSSVLADQNDPLSFDRRYHDTDELHPNDAGYQVKGDSIDLSLIQK